jgi:aminoglycoside phosphotransferase (APT) family kinase protein
MAGLHSLPDAPAIARIVAAAAGDPPDDLRPLGRGVTAMAWRAEVRGESLVVLVELPDAPEPANLLARAAVQAALAERGLPCAAPVATYGSDGIADPLEGRHPWLVTAFTPGEPAAAVLEAPALGDLGRLLAGLHSIRADGYGLLEDRADAIRGRESDRNAGLVSRWQPEIWPYDGRPLVAHPVARLTTPHVGALAALRDQLLRYGDAPAAVALAHTDLNPAHIFIEDGRLTGLIDWGDAAIVPPAFDIASFAYYFGWEQTEGVLEAYEPGRVLRDVRRAEAQQLGVVLALQKLEKHTTRRPDPERVQQALAFLAQTLPLALRRDA